MNVHLIVGEDDFLVEQAAKKALGGIVEGLEVYDSRLATNAELQLADLRSVDASFSTPPFLEPRKATWWKNVAFLPQSGRGPSEEVKAALEKFAKKIAAAPLPDNQVLVISGPRMLKTSVFAKTLAGVAEVAVFASVKPGAQSVRAAVARAAEMAAEAGFSFRGSAAAEFVARVGSDTRSLMSEIAKLRDYLGPGAKEATSADVAEIASPGVGVEPEVWAITDALGARDAAKLAAAVQRFASENGFAVLVTSVAERFFRQLVAFKDAEARGKLAAATEGMNPYAAQKNAGFLRNWTLRELRVARCRLVMLREKAVSTSGAVDDLVLPELLRAVRRPASGQ